MRLSRPAFLLVAVAGLACSGDAFAPTAQNMTGTYYASSLTVTDSSGMHDIMAAGGSHITLTLMSNGTVGGSMLIKDGNGPGNDLAADMAGTWQLTGSTITIDQTADTFVRDMPFTANKGRISGQLTTADGTVRVAMDVGAYIGY